MPFLHPLFSDHAVLQRDADVPVWGWANPDTEVTVEFAGQTVKAKAGKDGKWMATLAPMGYSAESRTMKVSGTANNLTQTVEAKDILVGDVWLCSGQSNMEMGIKNCNAQQDIDSANFPNLRLLSVPKSVQYKPRLPTSSGSCSLSEPDAALRGLAKGWSSLSSLCWFR